MGLISKEYKGRLLFLDMIERFEQLFTKAFPEWADASLFLGAIWPTDFTDEAKIKWTFLQAYEWAYQDAVNRHIHLIAQAYRESPDQANQLAQTIYDETMHWMRQGEEEAKFLFYGYDNFVQKTISLVGSEAEWEDLKRRFFVAYDKERGEKVEGGEGQIGGQDWEAVRGKEEIYGGHAEAFYYLLRGVFIDRNTGGLQQEILDSLRSQEALLDILLLEHFRHKWEELKLNETDVERKELIEDYKLILQAVINDKNFFDEHGLGEIRQWLEATYKKEVEWESREGMVEEVGWEEVLPFDYGTRYLTDNIVGPAVPLGWGKRPRRD